MLEVRNLQITQKTTTGSQAYTGVGFKPKAIILLGNDRTTSGNGANWRQGIGFATSSTNRAAMNVASDDAATTAVQVSGNSNVKCWQIYNSAATPAIIGAADLTSMDSDGFTLNWTTTDGTARALTVICLGGSDLQNAFVKQVSSKTTTGNQSETGVGFKPDCIIAFSTANPSATATRVNAMWSLGWGLSSSAMQVIGLGSDASSTSKTMRSQISTKLIRVVQNYIDFLAADLVSLDADGFTLNWSTVQSTARFAWVLCLKGGVYKVGHFTQATTTGNQATSGLEIRPTGLLLASDNQAASATIDRHARGSFGFTDNQLTQASLWNGDTDVVTPHVTKSDFDTTNIIKMMTEVSTGPTTQAAASIVSLDTDGFTLNWTTADATAREIIYLAFGSVVHRQSNNLRPRLFAPGLAR